MIYHIYANQSNIGDWLSAQGIQSLFSGLDLKENFCDTPFVGETSTSLSRATRDDFIIIGGGGLFMDYFAPFWKSFLPIAQRVPFCIWGAGCCDLKQKKSHLQVDLLKEVIARSEFCVVRDELSRSALSEITLPSPVPCPAFLALEAKEADADAKRLVNVVHPDIVNGTLAARITRISQEFAERTGREFRQTDNWIKPSSRSSLEAAVSLYASSDIVVTSRLHGCIIALGLGKRVIAISGDHKVESFMRAAGLGDWVLDLREVEALPAKLERIADQEHPASFVETTRQGNRTIGDKLRRKLARFEQAVMC